MSDTVLVRVCRCGHTESDHDTDCMWGWDDEPYTEPCDCTLFEYFATVTTDEWDAIVAGIAAHRAEKDALALLRDQPV
jgi:hypothetical protein